MVVCVMGGANLRHFTRVITLLTRTCEDLFLSFNQKGVFLSTHDQARTTGLKVELARGFFLECRGDLSPWGAGVKAASLLMAIRANDARVTLELGADSGTEDTVAVEAVGRFGLVRRYTFSELARAPSASIDVDPSPGAAYLVASPGVWGVLDTFGALGNGVVVMEIQGGKVSLRTPAREQGPADDADAGDGKKKPAGGAGRARPPPKTVTEMPLGAFSESHVTQNIHVAFPTKEVKAVFAHAVTVDPMAHCMLYIDTLRNVAIARPDLPLAECHMAISLVTALLPTGSEDPNLHVRMPAVTVQPMTAAPDASRPAVVVIPGVRNGDDDEDGEDAMIRGSPEPEPSSKKVRAEIPGTQSQSR
jgi:hypothetical protein